VTHIEASHFDAGDKRTRRWTGIAVEDYQAYLYRTRDFGKDLATRL